MIIRLLSDIHCEFEDYVIPPLPTDHETILILAGDIGLAKRVNTYEPFIKQVSPRFKRVIYLLGNHEHYSGNFPTSHTTIRNNLLQYDNVDVVERDIIEIENIVFICATMWTSFKNRDPSIMWQSQLAMSEYKVVRTGPATIPWQRKLHPSDIVGTHDDHRRFIFDNIERYKDQGKKVVVVTHHGCSHLSVMDRFKNDILTPAYVEELYDPIYDNGPDFWFHGHLHEANDYSINKTRIVVNPKGYPHENTGFKEDLVIEI